MNEAKQIEEMAKDVAHSISWCDDVIPTVDCLGTAAALYGIGYRKQSKGKWKAEGCHYTCSECDQDYIVDACAEDYDPIDYFDLHYCPNCGAKMKGGDDK